MKTKKNLFKELLQKRGFSWLSPKVRLRDSGIQGKGLFAIREIKKGEVVNVCGGTIVSEAEYLKLGRKYADFLFNYATQIEEGFYLIGGLGKKELEDDDFLNHSCDPNCGIRGQIVVAAMRDIGKGEELTLDYAMIDDDPEISFTCSCGSACCRKVVTGGDWRDSRLQRKYKGYFTWYIQEKIGRQE
ncbi:MAG: SET domain-containing protein-lysine N-methyltransferase [Candidatus Omnitrophica bacterium]|nr:SET domain-containing protein-lysine N-methyltransferase [Candidatus Omnitrophota bacterium]